MCPTADAITAMTSPCASATPTRLGSDGDRADADECQGERSDELGDPPSKPVSAHEHEPRSLAGWISPGQRPPLRAPVAPREQHHDREQFEPPHPHEHRHDRGREVAERLEGAHGTEEPEPRPDVPERRGRSEIASTG